MCDENTRILLIMNTVLLVMNINGLYLSEICNKPEINTHIH
jgi:hypothetical protein